MKTTQMDTVFDNPRQNIINLMRRYDLHGCLKKTAEMHGHFCPGSALGVMATVYGLQNPLVNHIFTEGFEELLAIVEVNACFADGIQAISGCTFGNNSLIFRDLGKHVVTFIVRQKGKGLRVSLRRDFRRFVEAASADFYPLMEKVVVRRQYTAEEKHAFKEAARKAAFGILGVEFGVLFQLEEVEPSIPLHAPIIESKICDACGEVIMATKVVESAGGNLLCRSCGQPNQYYQVDGTGVVRVHGMSEINQADSCSSLPKDMGTAAGPCRTHARKGPTSIHMFDRDVVFGKIGLNSGDAFLDLGCGIGDYSLHAARQVGNGGRVYSLDIQQKAIEALKKRLRVLDIDNISAMPANITEKLPLEDNLVDVCLACTVLHTVDLGRFGKDVFAEIHRVLKSGGRLVIIDIKKAATEFGPPMYMRVSQTELLDLVQTSPFEKVDSLDLGCFQLNKFKVKK